MEQGLVGEGVGGEGKKDTDSRVAISGDISDNRLLLSATSATADIFQRMVVYPR